MYLQPVVRCKNPDCPTPSAARIRLPYPNAPMSTDSAPDWPAEDWQLRLICGGCDHWYVYEKGDVQWAPFTRPLEEETRFEFQRASLKCGEPGCDSLTHWHVLDSNQMSEQEMLEFVLRADPVVVCENGHPFSVSGIAESKVGKAESI
jgi:hypothetical protein